MALTLGAPATATVAPCVSMWSTPRGTVGIVGKSRLEVTPTLSEVMDLGKLGSNAPAPNDRSDWWPVCAWSPPAKANSLLLTVAHLIPFGGLIVRGD